MESPVVTVILSGGSGSRLWPLSRDLYPKQLISLTNNNSLLQNAVLRAKATVPDTKPIIICNEEHRFLVAEQLREINVAASAIVLEPIGWNTAAAIAVSALEAISLYGESAIILVKPSDHVIRDTPTFGAAVNKAVELAKKGELVTFGIVPNRPDTAFGYIDASEPIEGESGGKALRVKRFVEKPNLETAQKFLKEGTFFWNSGMFVFPARRFLNDLQRFEPEILNACITSTSNSKRDLDFTRLDAASFSLSPSKSVDYAVMERVEKVAVVPLNAGWDDVGSWDALWMLADQDTTGTVRIGDVVDHDTSNSYIRAEHRLVATVGMDNVVVIETPDAVLVASKSRVQDVKKIVDKLKEQGRHEHIAHTRVFRPWGSTESIAKGPRYEVKRLIIKPGGSQSRQMHFHRTEHWVVVKGTAKVTTDEGSYLVTENESTYISVGKIHRLENPGKVDLEVIEIRSGSYMGEDDIVRVDEQSNTTAVPKSK